MFFKNRHKIKERKYDFHKMEENWDFQSFPDFTWEEGRICKNTWKFIVKTQVNSHKAFTETSKNTQQTRKKTIWVPEGSG